MSRSPNDGPDRANPGRDEPHAEHGGERLSEILTDWQMIRAAHGVVTKPGDSEPIHRARASLWERYAMAIRPYLKRMVNDPAIADEIYQEFALRVLSGAFQHADPEKGKFRKYLKTALAHLVHDHYNKARRSPRSMSDGLLDPADEGVPTASAESERQFLSDWKDLLLKASWERLRAEEKKTGRPHRTALRLYVNHDRESSAQLAERLSAILGRAVSASYFNKQVHNARKRHAFFLIDEVARTLGPDATLFDIEEELIALGLHNFSICRDALRDYRLSLGRREAPAETLDPSDAVR